MTRLVLVGGFLGAGKTTLLIELAKRLAAEGRRVAVVTNDQGERLVDTAFVRAFGFDAVEVSRGCFCCNFSRFVADVRRFVETLRPDVILAEPVGSCTDLAATVVAPLLRFHADAVELAPYLALAEGPRAEAGGYGNGGPPGAETDDVALLISHQLREAQVIAVSKADLLEPEARARAAERLRSLNPEAALVAVSAVTGEGLPELSSLLLDPRSRAAPRAVPIDYDRYAAAEAAYGWYDASWDIGAPEGFAPYAYAAGMMRALADWDAARRASAPRPAGSAAPAEAGVAHAKLLLQFPDGAAKFSLSGGRIRSDESILAPGPKTLGRAVLNVRARAEPEELLSLAAGAMAAAARKARCSNDGLEERAFSPGYPVPEERIT